MKRVRPYPGKYCGINHILLMGHLRKDLKKLKCGKSEPEVQLKC